MSARRIGHVGLLDVLGIVFLVLKLTHTIDWSWWWVTAPWWGAWWVTAPWWGAVLVIVVLHLLGAS